MGSDGSYGVVIGSFATSLVSFFFPFLHHGEALRSNGENVALYETRGNGIPLSACFSRASVFSYAAVRLEAP